MNLFPRALVILAWIFLIALTVPGSITLATETDRHLLDQAKTLFETDQIKEALATLEAFIAQAPPTPLLQEAYFLQAAALRVNNQPRQAIAVLEQLLDEFPVSPLANEARLMLGGMYAALEEPDRAVAVLRKVLDFSSDPTVRRDALRQIREIHMSRGKALEAVNTALEEMALVDYQERGDLQGIIQNLILQHLDEPALESLIENYPTRYPGDLATIRLIELHTARGDEVLAERDIRAFVKQFPDHPYAQTAMALLQSFMNKIKLHSHVIAALLPFSGPMKTFGTDSLNGIRMALEDGKHRLGLDSVGLVVKDTAAAFTPLRHEISQIIREFRPVATIGPLLSREVQALANVPDEYELPIITPSATLLNVRRFGSYWFSTSLTTALQAYELVDYAMTKQGFRRFCIIYPQTAYGKEFSRSFANAVERLGGEIIAIESYEEHETDISRQILHLKEQDLAQFGSLTTEKSRNGGERKTYTPGFDAVFLPGQPVHVASISAQLAFHDIKVPLLGGNSWHNPDLFHWARNGLDGSMFTDGIFLEGSTPSLKDFAQRYRTRFKVEPSLFSVQAYDATWLILDALKHGARTGSEVREQFLRRHDLPALSGLASFGSDGVLHRKIYIIQVANGQFVRLN